MPEANVAPLVLEQVQHPESRTPLYHHQAVVFDEWENHDTILVLTKTGTGKTTAAMLPLLKRRLSAVAVYPTNELLRDQISSIQQLADREGVAVCVHTPEDETGYADADVVLVPVDGDRLAAWCRKRHYRTKGEALQELLLGDKPKIVLTNPDVLFLIFALRYRPEALAALQQYRALVVDEFHLYAGVELAHALIMVHLGRRLNAFERLVLLSATPDPDVRRCLDRLFKPHVVDMKSRSPYRVVGTREAVHAVRLVPVAAGQDVVETAASEVAARAAGLRVLRASRPEQDYLPGVVVLNSVVDAIHLEDRLVEKEDFQRHEMAIIRGLSSREVRRPAGKLLAIGTAAIEVGIDFRCDWLIFEASEAASFMQRFGRVGRHEPGTAVILCPPNVLAGIAGLSGEIDRGQFEEKVYAWYSERSAYAWFSESYGGLATTRALVESLLQRVREEPQSDPEQLSAAADTLYSYWRSYAVALGADEREVVKVERH